VTLRKDYKWLGLLAFWKKREKNKKRCKRLHFTYINYYYTTLSYKEIAADSDFL